MTKDSSLGRAAFERLDALSSFTEEPGRLTRRYLSTAHREAIGAGHDAMMVAAICPIAMLFVRCAGGVSHNPEESVTIADVDAAIRVLLAVMDNFSPTRATPAARRN